MRFVEGIFKDVARMVEKASLKAMLVVRETELKILNGQLDKMIAEVTALSGKVKNLERLLEETALQRDSAMDSCQKVSARSITLQRGIREALRHKNDKDLAFSKLMEILR